MTDETQADRGDDGSEHATRAGMQDTGCHDHQESGPDRKRKRAQANRRHRQYGNQPRRAHRIDQRAPGHLAGERHEPAGGQNQPDIKLGPSVRGQIDRNERTETGLDVGEKKGEPVEAARASSRRRIACCGRRLLRCRRRPKTFADATVEPTAVKLQC
jgi:hypothetical protein